MNHIAIDLGSRQSQICVRKADTSIEWEGKIPTSQLGEYFKEIPRSRVIVETCAESEKVAEWALAALHEIKITPATLGRRLGVGQRGIKTDQRDARALSEASCQLDLPSVHIRSKKARERSSRLGARSSMVTARTQLINTVRGWLRGSIKQVKGSADCFAQNVRKKLDKDGMMTPDYIEHLLRSIEALTEQIKSANKELKTAAESDPVCQLLMGIPGIGPMTSLCFTAVVDDVNRFPKAHLLESYLGLTPGEYSSSRRVCRTGITKAGPSMMRHYLTQSSLSLKRLRPNDPIGHWSSSVSSRRGKQIATIAMARKLAGIMYAMWRDGTSYNPSKAASRTL